MPTAAPWTSGRRASTAASLARNLVAKLSEPSMTTSYAATSSPRVADVEADRVRHDVHAGKRRASARANATALRLADVGVARTAPGGGGCSRRRDRRRRRRCAAPRPRASASAAGQPSPPAPMMRTPPLPQNYSKYASDEK